MRDLVGLPLGTHRPRVGSQITRRRYQPVCTDRGTPHESVLTKGGFDDLYGVKVAVLPKKQTAHDRQELLGLSSAIKVAGYHLPSLVHPLPFV